MQKFTGTQAYMAPEIFLLSHPDDDEAEGNDTMSTLNTEAQASLARQALERAVEAEEAQSNDAGKVFVKPKYGEHCTAAVDVWAIGVIYFIMLRGEFPFPDDLHQIIDICSGRYEMGTEWDCISQESRLFTRQCLTVNYKKRPTGPQLLEDALFRQDDLPRDHLDHIPRLRRLSAAHHDHVVGKSVRSMVRMNMVGGRSSIVGCVCERERERERARARVSDFVPGD